MRRWQKRRFRCINQQMEAHNNPRLCCPLHSPPTSLTWVQGSRRVQTSHPVCAGQVLASHIGRCRYHFLSHLNPVETPVEPCEKIPSGLLCFGLGCRNQDRFLYHQGLKDLLIRSPVVTVPPSTHATSTQFFLKFSVNYISAWEELISSPFLRVYGKAARCYFVTCKGPAWSAKMSWPFPPHCCKEHNGLHHINTWSCPIQCQNTAPSRSALYTVTLQLFREEPFLALPWFAWKLELACRQKWSDWAFAGDKDGNGAVGRSHK